MRVRALFVVSLVCPAVAACALRSRCEPVEGPAMSGAKARVEVTSTNDTGLVRANVIGEAGLSLSSDATITITPDSGQSLNAAGTPVMHRTSRPFRLSV